MSQYSKCEKCKREVYQDKKCIFHYDKKDWYNLVDNKKVWKPEIIQEFWEKFEREVSKEDTVKIDFSECIFPQLQLNKDYAFGSGLFDEKTQYYEVVRPIIFNDSMFLGNMYFNGFKFNGIDLSDVTFEEGVSFERCLFTAEKDYSPFNNEITMAPENRLQFNASRVIAKKEVHFHDAKFDCKAVFHEFNRQLASNNSNVVFDNTKFLKLADFWKASFNEVSFNKTDFEGIAVFSKTIFNKYMEFKYTKFEQQLVFNRTSFLFGFDLNEALFNTDNVVFSNVIFEGDAENKETYQLIKYILDNKANFIEANKY